MHPISWRSAMLAAIGRAGVVARRSGRRSDLAQGDHLCAAVHRERRRDHAALGAHPGPAREGSRHQGAEHGDRHRLPGQHRGAQVQEGGDRRTSGPKSYVEASNNNYANVEPVAQLQLANGSLGYRSCLIVHAESDIFSPEDLAGRTFAFNDPNSTSGYLVPSAFFLMEMGVDPKKHFSKLTFSGSHEASILAVANKKVEVGVDQSARSSAAHARGQGAARRPPGRSGSRS